MPHLHEELVPGGVSEQVVDALEAVEVAEQHGELPPAPGLHGHRVLDAVHEQRAVRQAGERVVPGQVGHVVAEPEAREGVLSDGDQCREALTVVLGGRARPVQRGADDPQLLTAAVDGDADLGAGRGLGAKPDPLVAEQVTRTGGERFHDGGSVVDGLHAHGRVEQDLQPSGMLAPARLRARGHHDRADRDG